jgi:hypothetical protein
VLGDLCEDFLPSAPRAASPDAAADNVFSRFLADHHIRDDKPSPPPPPPAAPAAVHFPSEADMASQQQQQQQMMFHSHQQQQQEMVGAKSGLYRTVSSGIETAAPVGTGGASANASNLIRQSSSPAGFLDHLNMDNGWSLLNSAFIWYDRSYHSLLASLAASPIIAVLGAFFFWEAFLFLELTLSVSHLRYFAQFRIRGHAEGGHGHGGLTRW